MKIHLDDLSFRFVLFYIFEVVGNCDEMRAEAGCQKMMDLSLLDRGFLVEA